MHRCHRKKRGPRNVPSIAAKSIIRSTFADTTAVDFVRFVHHVQQMEHPWVMLKTGSTMPDIARKIGDFEDWFAQRLGMHRTDFLIVPVAEGATPPPAISVGAVIITGSPAMVTAQEPWIKASSAWLREVWQQNRPMLGVCFGHQLLADALGGEVAANPMGREMGTMLLDKTMEAHSDPLFAPLDTSFAAFETHSEIVTRLPPNAFLLASSRLCTHQAFRIGCTWGVQFHPEFDAITMREYIIARSDDLRREGLDPDLLLSNVRECSAGNTILQRFLAFVQQHS